MHTAPDRKLTTILSADVAGYSAMMERDETGTLALLRTSRDLMSREIAGYRGRIVNTAGDGLLAEFASVVNAVECAVRIQRNLAERNASLSEPARMRFRIGINLGDVMVDGDDLLGDGVNVAARLQSLAEPGGILISGPVFDQVKTKLSLGFDFLGAQAVKNISDPVPAWRVVLDQEARGGERLVRQPSPLVGEGAPSLREGAGEGFTNAVRSRTLLQRLKRHAAITAILIAGLFAINMLTFYHVFWFQWPSLALLTILGLRAAWSMGR
jgi:adenylate cyclase